MRRSKYGNRKTVVDGITFDSKKGAHQGHFKPGKVLEKECSYIADFAYIQDGTYVVEDTKGVRTEAYKIKRKLMLERYGIQIREV